MSASHKVLSNWYLQLAQHLEAGTTLAEALRVTSGPPAGDRLRLAAEISAGRPIEAVIRNAPPWLPRSDRASINAAMQTSRLPQTLRNLSDRHAHVGATQLKVVLGLLYPVGILHFAAVILPLLRMIDFESGFNWSPGTHLRYTAALLLPIWGIVALIDFLVKTENPLLPRILRGIPILRRYDKAQAMADFSYTLGTLLDAGVPIRPAWKTSVDVARDPALARAHQSIEPLFARGESPSAHLGEHKYFPADFVAFYETGARTGTLDQTLLHAGREFQNRANNAMTLAAIVYPSLLFLCIAGVIVTAIFQAYAGYLDLIREMME